MHHNEVWSYVAVVLSISLGDEPICIRGTTVVVIMLFRPCSDCHRSQDNELRRLNFAFVSRRKLTVTYSRRRKAMRVVVLRVFWIQNGFAGYCAEQELLRVVDDYASGHNGSQICSTVGR